MAVQTLALLAAAGVLTALVVLAASPLLGRSSGRDLRRVFVPLEWGSFAVRRLRRLLPPVPAG
jgi:hypothetical protein